MRGNYKNALSDLDKAIRLRPNFTSAVTERGLAWRMLGQYEKAFADYENAITIDPPDVTAHQNLGALYTDLNRYTIAFHHFDLAVKLEPNKADHYINRGQASNRLHKYQQAMSDYETYLRLNPEGAHAVIAKERLETLSQWQSHWYKSDRKSVTVEDVLWTEFVALKLNTTVAEAIQHIQTSKAYYVVTEKRTKKVKVKNELV